MIEKSCNIKQISYFKDFKCLGTECCDNCCISNWKIDVTPENKELYDKEAPDVAKDVEEREGEDGYRMKKHQTIPRCDCRWYDEKDHLCGIQKKYNETFLPDICRSFPRSYKKLDEEIYMTANFACPENLRLALYTKDDNAFSDWDSTVQNYTKPDIHNFKSWQFDEVSDEELLSIPSYIINSVNEKDFSAKESMARLILAANRLDNISPHLWHSSKEQIFKALSKKKVKSAENNNFSNNDKKDVITILVKAIFEVLNRDRHRWNDIVQMIKDCLGDNYSDSQDLYDNYKKIRYKWTLKQQKYFEPILKNFVKGLLSYEIFPIASYFHKKQHSMISFALQYLIVKLCLMCHNYRLNDSEFSVTEVIDIIQPIAKRFYVRKKQEIFDFCEDNGWNDNNKMVTILLNF